MTLDPDDVSQHAHELDTRTPAGRDLQQARDRADKAQADLTHLQRTSRQAVLGLRRQVRYWQLRAYGVTHTEAADRADLAGRSLPGEPGQRR